MDVNQAQYVHTHTVLEGDLTSQINHYVGGLSLSAALLHLMKQKQVILCINL